MLKTPITLSSSGSTHEPLAVGDKLDLSTSISADSGNSIVAGSDGGLFSSVVSNPIQYGSIAGAAAPTAAPTAANPATCMVNGNDEVFLWSGMAWVLVGNGYYWKDTPAALSPAANTAVVTTFSCPRAGTIQVGWQGSASTVLGGTAAADVNFYVLSGSIPICRGNAAVQAGFLVGFQSGGFGQVQVAAGEVLQFILFRSHAIGASDFLASVYYTS